MKSTPFLLAVALSLGTSLGCAPPPDETSDAPRVSRPSPGFEVGEPFPTLALPALDGGAPASVADFKGKKLILHVFASW